MRKTTYIKISDMVQMAETLAREHGGYLPNPQWLINHDLWAMYQSIRRYPKLFAHIRKKKNNKVH